MYVCIYLHIYVCMYICAYIHIHTRVYSCFLTPIMYFQSEICSLQFYGNFLILSFTLSITLSRYKTEILNKKKTKKTEIFTLFISDSPTI